MKCSGVCVCMICAGGLVLEGMEVKVQMSSDKTTIEDLIPKQASE